MEELQELLRVSLSGRIKGIETFNQFTEDKKSLTFKLFSNIVQQKINTDAEAREALYGKNYSGKRYDVLKRRFKEKLYTNLLFVQPRQANTKSYAQNAYFVHKHYIVGKLLFMAAARSAGRFIMQKVLKRAQLYEVTEIAMLAALRLKKEAAIIGDLKLHLSYADIFHRKLATLEAETAAEEKYEALFMHFAKSYRARPDLIPQAKEAFAYIDKLKNTYDTFILHQTSFLVYIFYSDLCDNYKETLRACLAFEQYLLSKPLFYSQVRQGNIIIHKLNCFLYLGQYGKGLLLVENGLSLYESTEGNWLVMQQIHFQLAIRADRAELAASIFQAVSSLQKRKNIDERQKEIWRIYGGYLWFYLSAKNLLQLRAAAFDNEKHFRLSKLLNEVPIYAKDKQSINLSLHTLQLVLFLQWQNYEKAIEKIVHLKTYIHKYIDRETGARDYAFLKLILLLQKYNFQTDVIKVKSAKWLEKLKNIPIWHCAYVRNNAEVLLYKQVWQLILQKV